MKNTLRILLLCIVGVLAVNCSSEDNNNSTLEPPKGKKELKVIDNFVVTHYEDNEILYKSTVTYNYNEDGTVSKKETIDKGARLPEVDHEIVYYTYKDKLPQSFKIDNYSKNKLVESTNYIYYYANNKIVGGITQLLPDGEVRKYSYFFNSQNQLKGIHVTDNTSNRIEKSTYEYDNNGNIIKVDSDGTIELITYDDKKSPFTNMNLSDLSFSMEYFSDVEQFLIYCPQNITKTIFNATGETLTQSIHTIENKYDKDDYLELATSTINNKIDTVIKYTYKTITIPIKQ